MYASFTISTPQKFTLHVKYFNLRQRTKLVGLLDALITVHWHRARFSFTPSLFYGMIFKASAKLLEMQSYFL